MSVLVAEPAFGNPGPKLAWPSQSRFPPRVPVEVWEATLRHRDDVVATLTSPPFVREKKLAQQRRAMGVVLLVGWLGDQPGRSWQERWLASGADTAGDEWRRHPAAWLADRGYRQEAQYLALCEAVSVAIGADLIRPSLSWLLTGGKRCYHLLPTVAAARDPERFAELARRCENDPSVNRVARTQALLLVALIVAAKGGTVRDMCVGDVVEALEANRLARSTQPVGAALLYRMLRELGVFGADAPPSLRTLRIVGARSCEELIDRYALKCRPIRDLLVEYLRERQPAIDYTSLESLARQLGGVFWMDLERHHPGIDSLCLTSEVASGWKQRLRTVRTTAIGPSGARVEVERPRRNYRECLVTVRGFYLDLAAWALDDPARWAAWVTPCPVRDMEIDVRKDLGHRKSRMDARTRERLPVLPSLARSVNEHRQAAQVLLDAARYTRPGETFTAAGTTLRRALVNDKKAHPRIVWAEDPSTGTRRDLTREEDHAFWSWAVIEVLRATGVRVEELLQISRHSLVQYRLPTTGDVVPLLQIVPSKTDAERLLLVSPDLADVLSTIITRISGDTGTVPSVPFFDSHERVWLPPVPLLFQHRLGVESTAISSCTVRKLLVEAIQRSGIVDIDGQPLHYTPHDFRRIFITDSILNGLPPHIAQVIAGHKDINVTMGYAAIYPEETIRAHLAFLARRRSLRPGNEYRVPTDDEWQEFLGHFERRRVALGTCARAFGTGCIHEHACVRCPMLWPEPTQRTRLIELIDNLNARIAEAEREGWSGEVDGLQISLAGARDKLAQLDTRPGHTQPVELGPKPPAQDNPVPPKLDVAPPVEDVDRTPGGPTPRSRRRRANPRSTPAA